MPQQSATSNRPGAAVLNSVLSFFTTHMNRCIDGWRAGDRKAADELVRRTQTQFRHLAERMYRRFPNVRPVGEVDDLINEGWVRLLQALKNIRPENTKQFYILAGLMLNRQLLDMARQAKRLTYRVASLEAVAAGGGSSGFDPAEPGDRGNDLEMWELFHEAVPLLKEHLREVVILRFYQGHRFTAIAPMLGKDERTIRRWWEEACKQIRAYVNGSDAGGVADSTD